MNKPWELKTDHNRTSDDLYTFNIFCEGRNSEPIYFAWFETPSIKVISHGDQKSMCRNVNKTLTKCLDDGILKRLADGKYELYEEGMEIWCAFDRDKGSNGISIKEGDVEFNSALTIAQNSPLKIAWSNDSFDLWILLHFEHVMEEAKNRTFYFEKPTAYFKNHPNPMELLKKTLEHKTFSYERDLKQEKKIKQIIIPEIIPKTALAIERAKELYAIHQNEIDFAKKMPCTTIFQLVERLLEIGGKKLPWDF
jgi:hypothetical protein